MSLSTLINKKIPQARDVRKKSDKKTHTRKGKLIIAAGKSDSGKTFFGGSAPAPIVFIDMDDGTQAFGEQYDEHKDEWYDGLFPEKEIHIIPVDLEKESKLKKSKNTQAAEFSTSFVNALDNAEARVIDIETMLMDGANIRTLVFETMTWVWMGAMDWMKYKVLEMSPDVKEYVESGFDWAVAQKRFLRLFKRVANLTRFGTNVIMTVHTKDILNKKMEPIGEKIHWWAQAYKMSPIILWIKIENKFNKRTKKLTVERRCEFERIRGVDDAKSLAEPMYDVTWYKMNEELSKIRILAAEKKGKKAPVDDKRENKSADQPVSDDGDTPKEAPTRRKRRERKQVSVND